MIFCLHSASFLTDLEAMGIPVSSTGPIPENLISLSSLVGAQLRGRVAALWMPLDSAPELQLKQKLRVNLDYNDSLIQIVFRVNSF